MSSYLTPLGSIPIIDNSNMDAVLASSTGPGSTFSTGYSLRNYAAHPFATYAPEYSGQRIPRNQWDELLDLQDKNESSPWHVHVRNNLPILDQNGLPYCWMYGTVAGVMNRYAAQGIDPVPHLSATGPAAQGKRWREQGGWAGEAIEYIERYGIPTVDTWPEHSMQRSLVDNHQQKLDAAQHKIVSFQEIQSRDFDAAVSALIDPLNPTPVTLGLAWWGHLVCGLRAVKIAGGRYGILIVNSWTKKWGENGYAVLAQDKATAHEYVRIASVQPRSEAELRMAVAA